MGADPNRAADPPPANDAPTLQDWLLGAISLAFVLMGLVILPSDPDVGVVSVAFFGSCLAVFIWQISGKLRRRRRRAAGVHVEVVGGVPIRVGRTLPIVLGVWLTALGIVLVLFSGSYPWPFRVIAVFIGLIGAALLAAVAARAIPYGEIVFTSEGLVVSDRNSVFERGWTVRVPWDRILAVVTSDLQGNPMLLVMVDEVASLDIDPPDARDRAQRGFAHRQAWTGAPIALLTDQYGVAIDILAAALERYSRDPAARAELRPQLGRSSS